MKWPTRSLQILCAISLLATSCGSTNLTSQPPIAVLPQPISDGTGEFLNVQINYVGFQSSVGDTDGTGELQLITIVSDENGHSDALICPYGAIIEIQSGDLINPCNAAISYPQSIVGENLYIMIIAVDNDDTGILGDVTSGVVSTGLAFGLKEAIATAGFVTTGSAPVVIGFLALDAVISYAGGKVLEYFENSDVIGSQSFILSRTKDWNNNNPVVAKSEGGDVEFSFVVQQSSTTSGQLVNSEELSAPEPTVQPIQIMSTSATDGLKNYYEIISKGNYNKAWGLLTESFKSKYNSTGYQPYAEWWSTLDRVEVKSVNVFFDNGKSANLDANIVYYYMNGQVDTNDIMEFYMIYDSNSNQWLIDDAILH